MTVMVPVLNWLRADGRHGVLSVSFYCLLPYGVVKMDVRGISCSLDR